MGLKAELLARIKSEVQNDPEGRGYSGKTVAQIVALLNEAYATPETVQHQKTPRISAILVGLGDSPNAIELQDLTDALAS